jgi:hypothetical protein
MQYYLKIDESSHVRYTPVLFQEYINFEGLGTFLKIERDVQKFSNGRLICLRQELEKYLYLFPPEKEIILNQYNDDNIEKTIQLIVTGIIKTNQYCYIYVKGVND